MNISFSSPINDRSYGIVGIYTTVELQKLGHKVSLWPIGPSSCPNQFKDNIVEAWNNSQYPDFNAPSIRLYHEHDLAQHIGKGIRIGWPIFERNVFNGQQLNQLVGQDILFVCSHWAKEVIKENVGNIDVRVVPLGVDRTVFHENYLHKYKSPKTIFWHQGKIEQRKGHDILHQVFYDAFPNNEDVELWVSWANPFVGSEETSQWESMYKIVLGDRVKFIPWFENPVEFADLMSQTDCGIWLSRSEGFCLPCLEYLSMGKPVIAPNYSGFTEYLNNKNSYLVEIEDFEQMYDGVWFKNEPGTWATYGDKQHEQIVEYLRQVHKDKQSSIKLVNEAGIETARKFSWENTAKVIENELSRCS